MEENSNYRIQNSNSNFQNICRMKNEEFNVRTPFACKYYCLRRMTRTWKKKNFTETGGKFALRFKQFSLRKFQDEFLKIPPKDRRKIQRKIS